MSVGGCKWGKKNFEIIGLIKKYGKGKRQLQQVRF
jgi:hypothetical protein